MSASQTGLTCMAPTVILVSRDRGSMIPPALPLLTSRERDEARRLVEAQGLSYEACDDVVGIYEQGRLVATAGRAGEVLKLFAIDEAHQGGQTLGRLLDALTALARADGREVLLVFTRPGQASSFAAYNFRLLASGSEAALLEHGGGLEAYLARHAGLRRPGANGAVVVNGNPFTLGHLHLVETAASRVSTLYLFVVREDRSVFPFEARLAMAKAATSHLPNVVVLDTSRYAVSAATFPSYFLRRTDRAARAQMEVDATLFAAHVAPAFSIERRLVGEELTARRPRRTMPCWPTCCPLTGSRWRSSPAWPTRPARSARRGCARRFSGQISRGRRGSCPRPRRPFSARPAGRRSRGGWRRARSRAARVNEGDGDGDHAEGQRRHHAVERPGG